MSEARVMPRAVHAGMIKVSGKEYLPVPFRVLWMREEKPLWGISTEIMEACGYTLVRATVYDENGRVISTAHKAVTGGGKFPPIEKAETGAMGRALGAAGFGTQFGELDEEEPGVMGGISDSPVSRPPYTQRPNNAQQALMRSVDRVGDKNGHVPGDWETRPHDIDDNGEIQSAPPPTVNKAQASAMLKGALEQRGWVPPNAQEYKRMLKILIPIIEPEQWATHNFLGAANLSDDTLDDAIKKMYVPDAAGKPNNAVVSAAEMYQSPESAPEMKFLFPPVGSVG